MTLREIKAAHLRWCDFLEKSFINPNSFYLLKFDAVEMHTLYCFTAQFCIYNAIYNFPPFITDRKSNYPPFNSPLLSVMAV